MNNNDTKKKRRVDSGIPAGGESGDGGIKDELSTIKSIMLELLNQYKLCKGISHGYRINVTGLNQQ